MTELREVARELYGAPLADFVTLRTTRAREARGRKDRELAAAVGALRKPTAAAWAVNLLVRHQPDEVGALLTLGAQLRDAQARLSGEDLRTLDRQRHQVVAAMVRQAAALTSAAGQRLSGPVAQQVEGTLRAAMTDPAAAAVVLSGLLTHELTSTGFDPVDLTDASAVPAEVPADVPADVPAGVPAVEPPPGRHLHVVPAPASERVATVPRRGGGRGGEAEARRLAREEARRAAREEALRAEKEEARRAAQEEARRAEKEEARRVAQEDARRRREARAEVRAAERAVATAGRALVSADAAVRSRTERAADLMDQIHRTREQIRSLTAALDALERDAAAADGDLTAAQERRDEAERAARDAEARAAAAHDALGLLAPPTGRSAPTARTASTTRRPPGG